MDSTVVVAAAEPALSMSNGSAAKTVAVSLCDAPLRSCSRWRRLRPISSQLRKGLWLPPSFTFPRDVDEVFTFSALNSQLSTIWYPTDIALSSLLYVATDHFFANLLRGGLESDTDRHVEMSGSAW